MAKSMMHMSCCRLEQIVHHPFIYDKADLGGGLSIANLYDPYDNNVQEHDLHKSNTSTVKFSLHIRSPFCTSTKKFTTNLDVQT